MNAHFRCDDRPAGNPEDHPGSRPGDDRDDHRDSGDSLDYSFENDRGEPSSDSARTRSDSIAPAASAAPSVLSADRAFDPILRPQGLRDGRQLEMLPPAPDAAFAAVFDSSAEALLVVDSAGFVQRANRRSSEILRCKDLGHSRHNLGEFLSLPLGGHIAAGWQSAPSPTESSRPNSAHRIPVRLDAVLSTGFPIRVSLRAILPDSQHLLLCLEEGTVVKRAESKWRQVEAELQSLLDSVDSGVILLDSTGRLRLANPRFTQLFGLDPRLLASLPSFESIEEIVAPRFRSPESFGAPWRSFAAGEGVPLHDELEMMRPTRRVLKRFTRPVLDSEGRSAGWLELYTDVSGDRQIQSKLLQTEKMAAIGQLVSGIAHELNNPLTAIMGYGQLLLGHGLTPAQLPEATHLFREAERARRIVKNLLYFARENHPERTRVQLNEIVERTVALRSYELKVENIVVDCRLAPDLPETMADPSQLQQVVLNLLVNAEQALLEGRGHGQIFLRTRLLPTARLLLEISDDGPGVPPEIASRIFDPFFTTKPPGVGTGLGLSIVYGIVQQHQGDIAFDSPPGGGARFVVELPVVAVPVHGRDSVTRPSALPDGAILAGRIIIVEDEPTVAQLIVDVLHEAGHHAQAFLDSQEALTRLSRERFDLVICDLRMPRLDGPAFYEALVRSGSPLQHHIIFITGDTLSPRTLEFLEGRGLPYLGKPFLVEELNLAVNRLLETAAAPAPNPLASRLAVVRASSRAATGAPPRKKFSR
ncbi:MAG: ATP-binding protein [Candidatus Acidiferrales bacterium]